ncbi:putative non-specific serine/threonine protein kinase [Helianthus annuus]|nr:putative non-specific serine/threonine protein kinase [Helianthus annuus]
MGNQWGLGLHFVFVTICLVATPNTCLGAQNTTVACFEHERLALLEFKQSVKDVSHMLSSWVGNDCCRWEGVKCNFVTGNVGSLQLRGGGWFHKQECLVSNEVSTSLGELRHLKYLDLSMNDFQESRIPKFIGSLKELTYLNLSYAKFSGIIPHQIGNLSNLITLDLSSNDYNENLLIIHDMAWISGLSSLEHLNLSWVNLRGAKNLDMVLYMIPLLKELWLLGCGLSNVNLGALQNVSTSLSNIKHLNLARNSFKGQLPHFFQNMSSLQFLDLSLSFDPSPTWNFASLLIMIPSLLELRLSYCNLKQTHLSYNLHNLTTLSNIQHLDLSYNELMGPIPTFPKKLTELYLSGNYLKGSITESLSLGKLRLLQILDLSLNELSGPIPTLPNKLTELYLSGNHLNGSIPESLGKLRLLQVLDLSGNELTGPIPTFAAKLIELYLYDNFLKGSIPESCGRLAALTTLSLKHNELNGTIPVSIEQLSRLQSLDVSQNQLSGTIPVSFGQLSKLQSLDVSRNQLSGILPVSIGQLSKLQSFDVSRNQLSGTIPITIGQLSELSSLDISYNSLEGVVSESHFAKLSMLKYLDATYNSKLTFNVSSDWLPPFQLIRMDLSSCKIKNGFPQWLRNQRKLNILDLSNATISGPLPTWLRKMPIIPFINLSHNNLSGPLTNLPSEGTDNTNYYRKFGAYQNYNDIRVLSLQSNLFKDSIPRSLCKRKDLHVLNLSKNWLSGKIPKCFKNLQNLIFMQLNSNGLSGVIPSFIGNLSQLEWLSFNDNKFSGELHAEFWNLSWLLVLDLGDNALCGQIPESFGETNQSLWVLRLHNNNFSGEIPQSLCTHLELQILDVAHNNFIGTIPRCLRELHGMVHNHSFYNFDHGIEDGVIQVMKGISLEYTNTWSFVTNLDLSSNKLVGDIPAEITKLYGLHWKDGIIKFSGFIRQGNELDGLIPPSIAALTFLSHLNLSNNNLCGRIPTGSQLQTLIDPSIYAGNKDLCGAPLPKNCSNHEVLTTAPKKKYEAVDEPNKVWFYVDIICGFATGFWGVIVVLMLKKQWRHKLFIFAEESMDKIHVAVMVRVNKMKRGRGAM